MEKLYITLLLAPTVALLGACANPGAQPTGAGLDADCIDRQLPTGSNIARRDKTCAAMTEAERIAAREELQKLRDQQAISTQQRTAPGR